MDFGEQTRTNVVGPIIKPKGKFRKNQYIITFTDDYSRYTKAYCLSDKTGADEAFLDSINTMEAFCKDKTCKVNYLRIDNGTKHPTPQFKFSIKKENIILETTPPY